MTATESRDRVVRSQVEPRLVERRRQVVDEERRRRRRSLVILGVVLAVVAAMVGTLFSPLLDVDRITVVGAQRLPVDELRAASGITTGESMVEVDLDEARAALRAVDGVRSAVVTREWPSTVRIVVTEERAVAGLVVGGTELAVSGTGRVLAPAVDEKLVPLRVEEAGDVGAGGAVVGAEVAEDVLASALALDRMADGLRAQVAAAALSGSGALSFELTDGATVLLGPVEDLPAKLSAAEAVLAQVRPECRDRIDVREPSRVTVSRRDGCQPPPVTDSTVPAGESEG